MNIQAFLEFPGILVFIGIVLLIISIILGIFAYKRPKKEDISLDNNIDNNEVIYDASNNMNNTTPINFFNNITSADNKDNEVTEGRIQISEPMLQEAELVDPINANSNIESESITTSNANGPTAYIEETQDSIELASPVIDEPIVGEDVDASSLNNEIVENPIVENSEINQDDVQENNESTTVLAEDDNTVDEVKDSNNFKEQKDVVNKVTISEEAIVNDVGEDENSNQFNTGIFDINEFKIPEVSEIEIPDQTRKIEPIFNTFADEDDITIEDIINSKEETNPVDDSKEVNPVTVASVKELEEKEEVKLPEKPIYGGTTPLENVTLDFKEEKHDAYSNTSFQPTGNIVTVLDEAENKKLESDDIELL